MAGMDLYIDNTLYNGFTYISLRKRFLNLASQFNATLPITTTYAEYLKNNKQDYPIILGSSVKIYINSKIVFNGYIEKINVKQSKANQILYVSGRSITADLLDTTINSDVLTRLTSSVTLKQVCERVLSNLKINVSVLESSSTTQFNKNDYLAPQVGQSAFDFLNQYAKKRQVFLHTQGDGNIKLIRSTDTKDIGVQLLLKNDGSQNNILESDVSYDLTKLFNKYICHAQNNLTFGGINDLNSLNATNTDITGTEIDSRIRESRILNFISDTNLNNSEASDRATWQSNFNRSQFFIYRCRVPNLTYDNENYWDVNQLVQVIDTYADVDAKLLISEVNFSQSVSGGIIADLTMVNKDSYSLLSIENQRQQFEQQSTTIGDVFGGL